MPTRAAASAHCFLRCSVGATTVICCTTWWCSSHDASVSAKVVLPAPGVATARKSRGCSWTYLSRAPCCQARSLLAVPQGARPGKAGERWWEAVVVTVSGSRLSVYGIRGIRARGPGGAYVRHRARLRPAQHRLGWGLGSAPSGSAPRWLWAGAELRPARRARAGPDTGSYVRQPGHLTGAGRRTPAESSRRGGVETRLTAGGAGAAPGLRPPAHPYARGCMAQASWGSAPDPGDACPPSRP